MKRLLALLLTLCIAVSLCACGSSESQEDTQQTDKEASGVETTQTEPKESETVQTEPSEPETTPTEPTTGDADNTANVQVTIESCRFTDEIRAADSECATMLYEDKEGKVYIDAVLIVRLDSMIKQDAFTGYVIYDDYKYDLNFCGDSYSGVSVEVGDVYAPGARVHMFASVPDAAENAELEAVVTVNGKEYRSKVEAKDTRAPIEQKTELKVGDKKSFYDGLLEFEVVSCKYTKVLRGQDVANSKQYSGTKPFVDLVVKATNNATGEDMILGDAFFAYVVEGDNIVRGESKIETDNNTDLKLLSLEGLRPGQTEYIHIYVPVEETQNPGDLMIRMNFCESCFYCYAS